ncbi:hypothetical protein PES01_34030 [Pseudoalteromonas espejiana]|uniref:Uncharacterized protein n=1 Tax=Pseudoalteromonas espejiana TaxID=28107 RepID=A0A510XZW3_9GAMM|nr:hypothetical protein PES01_34030 [Pseudoalteromonas espejiana]
MVNEEPANAVLSSSEAAKAGKELMQAPPIKAVLNVMLFTFLDTWFENNPFIVYLLAKYR